MVTDESQWYVQKGSRVQGPFSTNEVGRFLLLGRVRNTDRVSRDGELWEPVTQAVSYTHLTLPTILLV